jgi:hypothetical protein
LPVLSGALYSTTLSLETSPTPRIRRSWASGRKRMDSTTDIKGTKHYILDVPGPTCRGPVLLCMPPFTYKRRGMRRYTHTRNLRLASSYKPSSNTSHNGVGCYAPAARTTLNPRVFLSTALSLLDQAKRLSPSSSQDLGRVHSATRPEIYSPTFGVPGRSLGIRFSLDFWTNHDGADRRAPHRDFGRFRGGGRSCLSHPVLEGKPNANHVRARISNSRTQRLHK